FSVPSVFALRTLVTLNRKANDVHRADYWADELVQALDCVDDVDLETYGERLDLSRLYVLVARVKLRMARVHLDAGQPRDSQHYLKRAGYCYLEAVRNAGSRSRAEDLADQAVAVVKNSRGMVRKLRKTIQAWESDN